MPTVETTPQSMRIVRPQPDAKSLRVRKLILAVHGIGDQVRNETILSTAIRFCDHYQYPGMVALGAFYQAASDIGDPPSPPALLINDPPPTPGISGVVGFAEAHWADIARKISDEGYTLQETKAWARSIVNRIRVFATLSNPANANIDYRRIRLVLDEIIDVVAILESLLLLAKKAGLFEFDLKKILDRFLGDVQLVTEFAPVRSAIVQRFQDALAAAHEKFPAAEIHIVAHSEGTVVALLGLLQACTTPGSYRWIRFVRGFMTLGSPIDKHLILWPNLFGGFTGPANLLNTITWVNYVDYADPIGFNLDTAREWLRARGYDRVIAFDEKNDFSFRRYVLPGKAHVDYWTDAEVFRHFISKVVDPNPSPTAAEQAWLNRGPADRWWVPIVSYLIGYLAPLALIHLGVYILVGTIGTYLDPKEASPHPDFVPTVLGLSWLLAGTTCWVRIVRLTRTFGWWLLGLAIYAATAAAYWGVIVRSINAGHAFNELQWFEWFTLAAGVPLGLGSLLLSLVLVAIVFIVNLRIWARR